jgi:hypothetical protein
MQTLATYKKKMDETLVRLKYLQHMCTKKIDETLGIDACNIRVQPLQRMQHPDLLLQHPHEIIETYI